MNAEDEDTEARITINIPRRMYEAFFDQCRHSKPRKSMNRVLVEAIGKMVKIAPPPEPKRGGNRRK